LDPLQWAGCDAFAAERLPGGVGKTAGLVPETSPVGGLRCLSEHVAGKAAQIPSNHCNNYGLQQWLAVLLLVNSAKKMVNQSSDSA